MSSLDDEQAPLSCASLNAPRDDCALYRFIVWAAVKRNACHKMTEEQRRECPLLCCRKGFPNHELMLRHLYTCEHLAGGEYWCYDCERAEKLNDAKCRRCLGHPSKRRKLMSMAKRVFGSLGNRPKIGSGSGGSSSSNNDSNNHPAALTTPASGLGADEQPPTYDSVFTPVFAELPSNEIHEIDSNEVGLPTIPEGDPDPAPDMFFMLQAQYPLSHDPQIKTDPHPPDIEADFINWGEPSPSPETVAPQNLLRPAPVRPSDKPALQLHTHGLEHYRPQARRRSKALAPSSSIRSTSSVESADSNSSTESYDISPLSGWSGAWAKSTTGFASVLTSPCDDLVSPEDALPAVDAFAGSSKPMDFTGPELGEIVANTFLSELPAEVPGIGAYSRELLLHDPMTTALEQSDFSFEATVPLHPGLSVHPAMGMTDGIDMPQAFPPAPEMLSASDLGNAHSLVEAAEDTLRVHISESAVKLGQLSSNAVANEFRSMSPAAVALAGLETMTNILDGRPATTCTSMICFIHLVYSLSLMVHEQDIEIRCGGLFRQALLYSNWFSEHERPWYIEAVYSLWKPSQISDADVIEILKAAPGGPASVSSGKGKAIERSLEGPDADSLVFVAQYFLDELEYLALREVEHPDVRASALCMHHIKDFLHMDHDAPSPFSIAAKFLVERGFSTQFYGVPEFLPSAQNIVEQVKSGRISTVRQLELELMQAGKPPPLLPANAAATGKPTRAPTPAPNQGPASIKVESNSCCEICGYRPKGDPRWFGGSMAKHKKLQHSEETKIYRCPYPGCTSQYSKRPDNLRQHQIEKGHFVDGQGPARKRSRKREWTTEAE
ncbi:hypothetical protein ESCO_003145 [Escovopsis weberi]|uniref:C2H2-type domain-containing protein n=1 Tax=Escovopsis weberi TaxID=150374 RepID=A0A0M9VSD2_ESCWE|nr:hypothetical protein ESCO_003145 [Escovopsis weberi]